MIRIPICSRQSASAADVVVEATITIGKFVSARDEISRSSPSIGLVRRDVLRGQLEYLPLGGRTGLEVLADHISHMRITGEQRAVAVVHGDGGVGSERDGCEEFFEVDGFDAAADDAEEFAVRPGDLARDHRGPGAGDAAVDRLDQHLRRLRAGLEGPEVRRGPPTLTVGIGQPADALISLPSASKTLMPPT